MALDHYISQVHLKNFYSAALGNRLYAVRKSDLKKFTPRADDICRIEDGSTNSFLTRERVIEEFLKTVEPRYNSAVASLRSGNPDQDAVYVIAGFVAFVASCAPAAMRLGVRPLDSLLRATSEILDRQGRLGPAPAILGNKSLTELLTEGTVHFDIDQKYPQAMGINTIIERISAFGNAAWEVLHNTDRDSPFFTSDFPVAIEARGNTGIMNRVVPLTPDLAVRILPDVSQMRASPDFDFSQFRFRVRTVTRTECAKINRLIVQCAEDLVFYRDDHAWIDGFVSKNRNFWVETIVERIPSERGYFHLARQRVRAREEVA